MRKLVLLRHGQSIFNRQNRFTGWIDTDLTRRGINEAQEAARMLKADGYTFDVAYTSVLKRAIRTLWITLDELDLMWIPVHRRWRLNERHYGALQGLNKAETAAKYGEEEVALWRRSFAALPPSVDPDDDSHPRRDPRYAGLPLEQIPCSESLKKTVERLLPVWSDEIAPDVRNGKQVLMVSHGNTLRALVKHLDQISDKEIVALNIPTGIPLVYELDHELAPTRHYYLGDPETARIAAEELGRQIRTRTSPE